MRVEETIAIVVNGEDIRVAAGLTLTGLLGALDREARLVAIEHNGSIVSRVLFGSTSVNESDQLEIVQFVQGGSATSTPKHLRCELSFRASVGIVPRPRGR